MMAKTNLLHESPVTLYRQIATLMRKDIEDERWVPGERLPSLEMLARQYGVALVTLRAAVRLLEEQRFVVRVQGRGTFVSDELPTRRWLRLQSDWSSLLRMWEHNRARLVRVADAVANPILHADDGTPARAYRYMRRVHFSEDVPYAVVNIYVDQSLYRRDPHRFDSEMVIVLLDAMPDVEIVRARQCLTITTADLSAAELLDVPVGSPVGEVRRVLRDQHGVAIYVGETVYRGDLVKLESELKRPASSQLESR